MAQHTVSRASGQTAGRFRRALLSWAAAGVVGVLAVAVILGGLGGAAADPTPGRPPVGASAEPPEVVPVASELPSSSTYTTVDAAALDSDARSTTDGTVVHPVRETPVHDGPGGKAIARMEPTQFGDTWLPVIGEEAGWVQVLLPSKPNGSTGWLRAGDVERARSRYVIEVHLGSKRLELLRDGAAVDGWTVGTGAASSPTPVMRTFLLGAFRDDEQDYSPVILPLGAHSPTHDSFGGGPGTVAIHTWPTDDVFGTASSNGCIRVPSDALDQLSEVPLGTLVMIDDD